MKKIADWIKDIKNVILSDKEADIKYIEKGEKVYLRKRIIGRNKLKPYWNDSN